MKTNGTEAFATIELPADIGKRRLATLRCKVDTGAGGNVMPLQKQILDVGTDDDPHYDEVRVAAVLNEVGTGMATALNQVGEVAVPRSTRPL